jgi:sugar lactone lactonase YvrE
MNIPRCLVLFCSLFAGLISVSAQTYFFTTLAGSPPAGYADGVGRAALFNDPRDVAVDDSGNVYVADSGNHVIRKVTPAGVVTTFAGTPGQPGTADGTGSSARFYHPLSVAVDAAGNVFVAENAVIRKVTPAGVVTTLAGQPGQRGNVDGTGGVARFGFASLPNLFLEGGIALDGSGNIFVADGSNHTIRKVTREGVVTTIAGRAGEEGNVDGNGDAARFGYPVRLAVDSAGNLLVADSSNYPVRKISPSGDVTTLVGKRLASGDIYGVAADRAGNVYALSSEAVGAYDWGEILRVTPDGSITRVAGGDAGSEDGVGEAARFFDPRGLALDKNGNLFVADTANHAIRKIAPDGLVTTLAGDSPRFVDATRRDARFQQPNGLALDHAGNVYVHDGGSIRKVTPDGTVTTLATAVIPPAPSWLPTSLAVDGSDNIFVSDGQRAMRKVSRDGVVTTLGASAIALTVDRAGNVFCTSNDHVVSKMAPDGSITLLAGSSGKRGSADGIGAAARFDRPTAIAVNSRGEVFVVDSGNGTIRKVSADGRVTTIQGAAGLPPLFAGPAQFYNTSVITVDSADNLLVANASTVRTITNGIVTATATILNPENYEVLTSIAVDDAGAIYVTSSRTVRKGILVPTGTHGSRLVNASILANFRNQQPLVVGFDLGGNATPVLVRAIGPGLQSFVPGVTVAGDPRLELFDRSGATVASNDNWGGGSALTAAFVSAGAFPLAGGSIDAALLRTVAGQATVHVTSASSGLGLVELFDLGPADVSGITNVSARHVIGSGADSSFTLGFTIEGPVAKTVLIRGIGPALATAPFNLGDALSDPTLAVFRGAQQIAENNNWDASLAAVFPLVGAFALPSGSKDAALLLTLAPGGYSTVLNAVGSAVGDAMIEIYEVP